MPTDAEKDINDLPLSVKPCKKVRSARKMIEQRLQAAYYKQKKAEEVHKGREFMPSPSLEKERERQQRALDSKNRADAARTEKARAYNRLKEKGKLRGLDDFEQDGTGAAP
jgi:flagellar biosynthesis/type III secretory pathway protein FliH